MATRRKRDSVTARSALTRGDISLGEFVKHLAVSLRDAHVRMPLEDERRWHLLFYELKKAAAGTSAPDFFTDMHFDWDGPYPKSLELSEFLQALHWNASVSGINPEFREFVVPTEVGELWASRHDSVDAPTKEMLKIAVDRARIEFAGL